MFPNLSMAEVCKAMKSKDKGNETRLFQELFNEGIENKQAMNDPDSENPPFRHRPESDVKVSTSCGYTIFQDRGLAKEEDVLRWTGKSSRELGLKSDSFAHIDFQGEKFQALPISLLGLPQDELDAMPKCRVWQSYNTEHDEIHLHHRNQIAQQQGQKIFDFVTQRHYDTRPEQLHLGKRTLKREQGKSQAVAQAKVYSRESLIALANKGQPGPGPAAGRSVPAMAPLAEDKEADDSDEEPVVKAKKKRPQEYGLGSLQQVNPQKAEKAQAAAKRTAQKKKKQKQDEDDEDDGAIEKSDSETGTNVAKIQEVLDFLEKTDKDMFDVATEHLKFKKSGGIACFLKLTVQTFLSTPKLGVCLQGVGVFKRMFQT